MNSYFKLKPDNQIRNLDLNSGLNLLSDEEVCLPQNAQGLARPRASRFGLRFVIRILAILISFAVLTSRTEALAQEQCQDLNELMNFNYRTWGIGTHRDCGSCDWDEPGCWIELAYCLAMKEKQILAGALVQQWIIASHNLAGDAGVKRIPQKVRDKLSELYPASVLDNVYYTTDSDFPGTLQWFRDEMGNEGAITLIDIIVFTDPQMANCVSDEPNAKCVKLWAHELEHVRQYQQLGVDGFAQAYFDQTCILPGEAGYGSGRCQIEWMAKRKSEYFNKKGFIACCTKPLTLELRDRDLSGWDEFVARDSITVGPNVTLRAGSQVKLEAGRVITMSPEFRSEPGGKLHATIDPKLNQTCTFSMNSLSKTTGRNNSP